MIQLLKKKQNFPLTNKTKVYAIGGGKGGIGKSFITSNLALMFASQGEKTLLIDLDFGGANAHTYLGINKVPKSIKTFLANESSNLKDVILPTNFQNLDLITASIDWSDDTILDHHNMNRLFKSARRLNYNNVVYDLGAGTNPETINAFLEADVQIAVSTPEPISIENTYQFLKRCFYISLKKSSEKYGFNQKLNRILRKKLNLKIKTPLQLLNYIELKHPKAGELIVKDVLKAHPYILINQCRSPRDRNVSTSLAQISRRYFGQEIRSLGTLSHETQIWQAVRSMKPLSVEYPDCSVLDELKTLNEKLKNVDNIRKYTYSRAA